MTAIKIITTTLIQTSMQRSAAALLFAICALAPVPVSAQAVTYAPLPAFVALDDSGVVISGAKLCTYVAGTTTPATTYQTLTLTPNTNPVVTDSAGRATVMLRPGSSYKFVLRQPGTDLTCSTGTILWTRDNIAAQPASAGAVDIVGTFGVTVTAGEVVYLSDGSGSKTAGQWFAGDSTYAYSSATPIIGLVTTAGDAGATGTIRLAGPVTGLSSLVVGTAYYASTAGALTATPPAIRRYVGHADTTTSLVVATNPAPVPVDNSIADGRLTLATATPVTTADQTVKTTLYYTPYAGNRIALYDSTTSTWNIRRFTELSVTNAGLTASKPYDVFVYDNAGTATLELLVWTNDTTRATALTLQDGVLVKTGVTTRRYVGTVYTDGASKFNDSATLRHVWNYAHRVHRPLLVLDATASWNYTTASYQQFNNSAANQVDVVIGVAETTLQLAVASAAQNGAGGVAIQISIGEDSATTAVAGVLGGTMQGTAASTNTEVFGLLVRMPAVGRHYYAALEKSAATGTTSWLGGASGYQTGLTGWIEG